MELLLLQRSGRWLLSRACRSVLLLFITHYIITDALMTFEMRFRDQVEKLRSDEYYHFGLRQFQADSVGAVTNLPNTGSLLIGARNCFFVVDLTYPFAQEFATVNWTIPQNKITDCLIKGEEEWECQNFVQVIEFDVETNRLVVCGTGAQAPVCRIYPNYPSLESEEEMDGQRKCPFDPRQQSTALFADRALYTATVGDYSGRDSLVYRSSVGQSDIVELRSREADAKWFNSPTFIQSFEVDEWILVFFREIAVEHVNSGDAIYARVGKVCKSDLGGAYILEEKWTTYQKARLNCSFPGAYPFYFNYLQDVWMVGEGDERMFYGVFSTGEHEIPGSAVCVFDMQVIREIFNEGQFKTQNSGNWYALPRDMEKKPRPGNCSLDSKRQSDDNLEFITSHPLMDQSVPSYGDPYPIFDLTRADYRLTQIAVYKQKGKDGILYNIIYLGTENGLVLKVVLIPDGDKFRSNLLEKIYVTPRDCQERVKQLEVIRTISAQHVEKDVLMVVTNSSVIELPLHRCDNYTSRCACIQDPFCVWNNIGEKCYEFELGKNEFDDQEVTNMQECEEIPVPTPTATECLCEPSSAPTEMHETTLIRTISLSPSSSSVAPEVPPTKPVENTTTVLFTTTTVEPGPGKDAPVTAIHPEGNGKEGNDIPNGSGNSANDPDSNHIGAESEASIGNQSNTQQLLVILVIAGWALFLICLPVIIFLIVSNRRKAPKQKKDGENQVNHLHLNGHSTYHHLSPQVSLQESSTGQPPNSVEPSRSRTPSKAATLERGTPQGASRTQSLSRKPTGPPPVPPKRTSSVLSHNGPRCPPTAYTKSPQRGSNPTTPTKKRQNSSSSSDSSDREPPPYRPLSGGSEDDRRRRPSGASNHEVQPEFDPGWYQNQVRSHEQSV